MKYGININQKAVIALGLELDLVDMAIFDDIFCFATSGRCQWLKGADGDYFWLSPKVIIEDLPLLGINSERGIRARISKLVDTGLLVKCHLNQQLGRSYYALGPICEQLFFEGRNESSEGVKNLHGGGTKLPRGRNESSEGSERNFQGGRNETSDDYNTNDYNTNYNTNTINNPPTPLKGVSPLTPNEQKNQPSEDAAPLPYTSEEFRNTWAVLCRQPKWKKKSKDALRGNLKTLAGYPEDIAIRMMQNSINNDWQGLFPLKAEDLRNAKSTEKREDPIVRQYDNIKQEVAGIAERYERRTGKKMF